MLSEILKERRISQSDLARELGVTRSAISALAGRHASCSPELLAGICSYLNVSPEEVLQLNGDYSLHDLLERRNLSEEVGTSILVAASALHRARERGCDLETAGWCGALTAVLFRIHGGLLSRESVGELVGRLRPGEERIREVVFETLTDPVLQWHRQKGLRSGHRSVFLLCPVEDCEEDCEGGEEYLKRLRDLGVEVHYPPEDTPQADPKGMSIVLANLSAIGKADEVHAIWNKRSPSLACDLQTAMALGKPFFLVNQVEEDSTKSYTNVALLLDKIWRAALGREGYTAQQLAEAVARKD